MLVLCADDSSQPRTTGSVQRPAPLLRTQGHLASYCCTKDLIVCDEVGNDDREAIEHLFDRHDWTTLSRCLHTKHGRNHFRPAFKRIAEELIGRFNWDTMGITGLRGKVAKVGRHDDARLSRKRRLRVRGDPLDGSSSTPRDARGRGHRLGEGTPHGGERLLEVRGR